MRRLLVLLAVLCLVGGATAATVTAGGPVPRPPTVAKAAATAVPPVIGVQITTNGIKPYSLCGSGSCGGGGQVYPSQLCSPANSGQVVYSPYPWLWWCYGLMFAWFPLGISY